MPDPSGNRQLDPFFQVQTARRVVALAGFQPEYFNSRYKPTSDGKGIWFDVVVPVRLDDFNLSDEDLARHVTAYVYNRAKFLSDQFQGGPVEPPKIVSHQAPDLRTREGRAWKKAQVEKVTA